MQSSICAFIIISLVLKVYALAAAPALQWHASVQDFFQTSLTLDRSVIASGFSNDGQDIPIAGQTSSLTSTNNFINFCATLPSVPLTNGRQIPTGSCNPTPMGMLPSTANMPSSKFVFPKNGAVLSANVGFTIEMAINNLQTGSFVNSLTNYMSAPQTLNSEGNIIGHSHFVIEAIASLDDTTPTDPRKFAFFKGVTQPAEDGVLKVNVDHGLPAGTYRLASINSASNHQPVLVPVVRHGFLNDMVYFTLKDGDVAPETNIYE